MTKIRMDWDRLRLTAEGHAGGGPKGQDIVCAGISALTMALVNQLMDQPETGTTYQKDDQAGTIVIDSLPAEYARERVKDYYRVIMTGLQAWEAAFPDNIKTEEVNTDGIA